MLTDYVVVGSSSSLLLSVTGVCCAEGEGEFFDAASLQCAPGVSIQSLLAGGAPTGEHAGEEYDEVEEDDDDEEVEGDAPADVQLAVTGHAIHPSTEQDGTHESEATNHDVDLENREGEVIFKR